MKREDLEQFAQPIVDIYNAIEMDMLQNIAAELKEKKELLATDPEAWKVQQLEMLGMLDRKNIQTIRKYAELTSRELNKMILGVTIQGTLQTDEEAEKALKKGAQIFKPKPISKSPAILNILKAYAKKAASALNLTNLTLLNQTKQSYIDVINKTAVEVTIGNKTVDQALRSTIKEWANKGIPALIDKGGKRWGTEGYVRTVLMTTNNNIANETQDERISEWGIELVEISSHAGNRPGCRPYAGRIFSLKLNHPKYPFLYDPSVGRIGQPDSLFGINCGHVKYPFVDGVSTKRFEEPSKAKDHKVYKESQVQRSIERAIRKAKTEEVMLKAAGDEEGAKDALKRVKQNQALMREFIKETGRTRRRDREQIITGGQKETTKAKNPDPDKELPDKIKDQNHNDIKDIMQDLNLPEKKVEVKKVEPKKQVKKVEPKVEPVKIEPVKVEPVKVEPVVNADDGKYLSKPLKKMNYDELKEAALKIIPINVNNGNISNDYDFTEEELIEDIFEKFNTKEKLLTFLLTLDIDELIKKETPEEIEAKLKAAKDVDFSNYKFIGETRDMIERHANVIKEKFDKLQTWAASKYTGNSYKQMNGYLRGVLGKRDVDNDTIKAIENLQDAYATHNEHLKLSEDTIFIRKIAFNGIKNVFGEEVKNLIGKAFDDDVIPKELDNRLVNGLLEDKGFVSTSYATDVWNQGDRTIEIQFHMPKGYDKGLFVESISAFANEKEFLLDAGQKFRIQEIEIRKGNVFRSFVLKVVPL